MDEEERRHRPVTHEVHEFEIGKNLAAFLERVLDKLDFQNEIREKLNKIMVTQEELNAIVADLNTTTQAINTETTGLGQKITTETGQVVRAIQMLTDQIAAILATGVQDVSGLTGIRDHLQNAVVNLQAAGQAVENIYIEPIGPPPPPEAPVAAFTPGVSSGDAPLTVVFTDSSIGGAPDSSSYDFGDGETSTETNPTHVFAAPGTYTVVRSLSNATGSSSAEAVITVTEAPGPANPEEPAT